MYIFELSSEELEVPHLDICYSRGFLMISAFLDTLLDKSDVLKRSSVGIMGTATVSQSQPIFERSIDVAELMAHGIIVFFVLVLFRILLRFIF